MASDGFRADFALMFEALEGLEPGRPLTEQEHWRLLKAVQSLKRADAQVREICAAMGVEMPSRPDPLRALAQERLVNGANDLPEEGA